MFKVYWYGTVDKKVFGYADADTYSDAHRIASELCELCACSINTRIYQVIGGSYFFLEFGAHSVVYDTADDEEGVLK